MKPTTLLQIRFGQTVRNFRKAQLLTLPVLAGIAGLSKGHLSEIEHGRCNVSLDVMSRLANALRIRICELTRSL